MTIDKLRKEKGWSLTEAAYNCGVSVSAFNLWRKRSDGYPGRLPNGEDGKAIELAFGIGDFRKLFSHDWPELGE